MTETRILTDGTLQVKHADLNGWLNLIAPILVENGWLVALAAPQAEILSNLNASAGQLPAISTRLLDMRADLAALRLLVDEFSQIKAADMLIKLAAISTASTASTIQIDAIAQLLQGPSIPGGLQAIQSKILDYSNPLLLLNQDLDAILAAVNGLGASINGITVAQNRLISNTPTIQNVQLITADQQYSVMLPSGTKRFAFKCRGDAGDVMASVRYAWQPGKAAPATGAGAGIDSYDVLAPGMELEESSVSLTSDTLLYFASNMPNVMMSIRRWS